MIWLRGFTLSSPYFSLGEVDFQRTAIDFEATDPFLSTIQNNAAIRMQRLAGNEAAILASKEHKTCHNLAKLPWATSIR